MAKQPQKVDATSTDSNGVDIDMSIARPSGKTLKTASGVCSSSGNNTIITAVTSKRLKVYRAKLTYIGTTAVVAYFRDGTAGAELDRTNLQSPASVTVGDDSGAVPPPEFLFGTTAGNALILNLSSAQSVHYSVQYWDDDAS